MKDEASPEPVQSRDREERTLENGRFSHAAWNQKQVLGQVHETAHLEHKNEHTVDLETGAIVAPVVHPADAGDPATLMSTLEQACESLREVRED